MSRTERFREQFKPWAGLAIGIVGTGFAHQFGSDSVFNDCQVASPLAVLLACFIGIAVTVIAALWSWGVASDRDEGQARRLIGIISVGTAALFVMATLLPLIAAVLIPPCFQ